MNEEAKLCQDAGADTPPFDLRAVLTWIATSLIAYGLLSGLAIAVLPFGFFVQFSILIHTAVGLASFVPVVLVVYLHRTRRRRGIERRHSRIAHTALAALFVCLLSGLVVSAEALFGTAVDSASGLLHGLASAVLVVLLGWHLLPVFLRYRSTPATPRRTARTGPILLSAALMLALVGLATILARSYESPPTYQAFRADYDWRFGDDRPFWPSRAVLADPPWQQKLADALEQQTSVDVVAGIRSTLAAPRDAGIRELLDGQLRLAGLLDGGENRIGSVVDNAVGEMHLSGALRPEAMTGSLACGSSGCHEAIYREWQASAHGFSAIDVLFTRVQALLSESKGAAETRSCAGCHDPVALLSGTIHGRGAPEDGPVIFEGNSCLVCHSTVKTDTEGNGGFVIEPPDRYLFEHRSTGLESLLARFLIRSAPDYHRATYSRDIYRSSDFCAACHKQVPASGETTSAGLAQEQNEYDSWKNSRWYHGPDDPRTIECRECHMPLVDSDDPASGDDSDSYRSANDGKHRSHRMLASNMYIPATMELPGGAEQAALTIAWLQGEIDIPEIDDKWTAGPVVTLDIQAPDEIRPGELINIKLHLHNNKTGHDFPAGPLDVLESWVELIVEDNLGNPLLELGTEDSVSPSVDAPVLYKADWYDAQGLPVERHNLWDVVGASYRRVIRSDGQDIVDVPFRCPGIARPRLSDSVSQAGPGERNSDVVFAIRNTDLTELRVTAKLLFRKANPDFLAQVYEFEPVTEAPIVELVRQTHTIRVVEP